MASNKKTDNIHPHTLYGTRKELYELTETLTETNDLLNDIYEDCKLKMNIYRLLFSVSLVVNLILWANW